MSCINTLFFGTFSILPVRSCAFYPLRLRGARPPALFVRFKKPAVSAIKIARFPRCLIWRRSHKWPFILRHSLDISTHGFSLQKKSNIWSDFTGIFFSEGDPVTFAFLKWWEVIPWVMAGESRRTASIYVENVTPPLDVKVPPIGVCYPLTVPTSC